MTKPTLFLILFLATTLPAQTKQPIDLLITGGTAVTMNATREILDNAAIAIQGDTILAIGPETELTARYQPKETIHAEGKHRRPEFQGAFQGIGKGTISTFRFP